MAETLPMQEHINVKGRFTVMPAYYLPKEKKKLSLSAWVAIVGAIIVVAVIVVFVLLYSATKQQPAALPQPQTPAETAPPQTTTTPTEQTPAPVSPAPVATEEPPKTIDLPAAAIGLYAKDTDTDQDGLTDVEERMFLTSAAVPDTDQDGYIDGVEVKNLYDPATPGALLEVSPQVKTVRNDSFGYQLLIPSAWTATKLTPQGESFEIKPEQGREAMMIRVYDNPDRLSVTDWYQRYATKPDLTQFVDFKNEGGWSGIQATDHTYVVAAYGKDEPGARAFIFVMVYDPGQENILRYPTVWDMMVNSLSVAAANP